MCGMKPGHRQLFILHSDIAEVVPMLEALHRSVSEAELKAAQAISNATARSGEAI